MHADSQEALRETKHPHCSQSLQAHLALEDPAQILGQTGNQAAAHPHGAAVTQGHPGFRDPHPLAQE